ncbi:SDR family NAD(P)-dependent oxidoreductase [Actinoplanes sp. NPDC051851]|uniref:SDR family NAD(P)-dependent oxidoreductase n=1 Tax=Actinoplanes sp. NPDC051851 TaxID=3154753 RepID=UPI0034237123
MRTWFITGGTPGGFGMAYAQAALGAGDRVVLTTRRAGELDEWAAAYGSRVLVLELDVTDPERVRAAVAAAESRFGGIDVLVNNAGRGWCGSVEGTGEATVRDTFELNFFAVVTVTRAVLPGMRDRGGGWIVMMSSAAGLRGVPGFGYYSAAKHAVEGLAAVLRHEVAGFGVRVLTMEPGAFRTNAYAGFAARPAAATAGETSGEAAGETVDGYRPLIGAVRDTMAREHGRQPGDPHRGVRAVLAAMRRDPPPERLVLGNAAFDAVTASLRETLSGLRATEALARSADFPGP